MDLKAYIEELREMVNIDSGTQTRDGVTKVAGLMEKKFKSIGWHAELKDCGDAAGRGLFATNKPGAAKYDALLVGHMDTVFPEGTVAERPMSQDDKNLYGPGVADMKSGALSTYYAMKTMDKADLDRLAIAVCLNPDEETGSNNSAAWIDELAAKSRYAFICEPSRGEGGYLVKARKGMARYTFSFSGVASHAGNAPEAGRSAIHEMAHFIIALTKLADKEKGTTINVGVVAGGDAANIVADKAKAVLDIRFWQNDDYQRVKAAIEKMVEKSFTPDVGISMELNAQLPAMFPTPAMEDFMKIVEKAGQDVGVAVRWLEAGGGSDGNHIAITGTPVLDGFGPTGGNFHSPKEFLEIDSIIPRVKLLQKTITSL